MPEGPLPVVDLTRGGERGHVSAVAVVVGAGFIALLSFAVR